MDITQALLREIKTPPHGTFAPSYFRAQGYARVTPADPPPVARAKGIAALFRAPVPHLYRHDWIVGSLRPLFAEADEAALQVAQRLCDPYPERTFLTNADHYAPDYATVLRRGVGGLRRDIADAAARHADAPDRLALLEAMDLTLAAFADQLRATARRAEALLETPGYDRERLCFIRDNCLAIADAPPVTFAQALQLVWNLHSCFCHEGRYAMALGRLDQYLLPFYRADVAAGRLDDAFAQTLLENALAKIVERGRWCGGDDVVNICIGGLDKAGQDATNPLSYLLLRAVDAIHLPGPNLSARIAPQTPDDFLDLCLQVTGTGLGYPALMNDTVNLAALRRFGYAEEDVRDYAMVGCIENFLPGLQPPWSDGRFDTPRFLNEVLDALDPAALPEDMEALMRRLEQALRAGAQAYMEAFWRTNAVADPWQNTSPFLSCFCRDCIARGLDINMGGSRYPSVHGVALMGVGTTCDALAAIEQVVFDDGAVSLPQLAQALRDNFAGHEALRQRLLAAPKYGNNDPFVDKYAVWFVRFLSEVFDGYRTRDGGGVYVAMAANISNIAAGKLIGATPDGRLAGQPLSDAASPTYGRDVRGVTSTLLSVSTPDYTRVACGMVLNQKFSPTMFTPENRARLCTLIRVYFARGGQQIQINATSTAVLQDAMDHPENYPDLVVRVSGFSALYVTLAREVQLDILQRTQQG